MGAPRRRPTAIRTSSSLRDKPKEVEGSAWSQEPDPSWQPARRRAILPGEAPARSDRAFAEHHASSHACCDRVTSMPLGAQPPPVSQSQRASGMKASERERYAGGRITRRSSSDDPLEARYADEARDEALLTPRPPQLGSAHV